MIPAAESLQSGEGTSYFVQRLRVRVPPVAQAAVAQLAEQSSLEPQVPSAKKDSGAVKVRVTSTKSVPVNTGKDCGQGTPPVPQGAEAQTNSRGPIVPTG